MKLNFFLAVFFSVAITACNSTDQNGNEQQEIDKESLEAINEMMAHQAGTENYSETDRMVIDAYEKDKTTISINDLDLKDTTYTMMAKILYMDENGGNLAVVYGKRRDKMGTAILQKEGGDAIKLPQTKGTETGDGVYSNGSTTITTQGTVLTLESNGKKEIYKRIEP